MSEVVVVVVVVVLVGGAGVDESLFLGSGESISISVEAIVIVRKLYPGGWGRDWFFGEVSMNVKVKAS